MKHINGRRFARRGFAAMLGCCALFAITPRALAIMIVSPGNTMAPRLQAWANAAAVPTADAVVQVRPQNCWQYSAEACMFGPPFVIEYPDLEYLFSGAQGSDSKRFSVYLNFLHELGHVFDFSRPAHPYRLAFLRILRVRDGEFQASIAQRAGARARARARATGRRLERQAEPEGWMHAGALQPDELFAMAYSYCAAGLEFSAAHQVIHGVYWGYGYDPSAQQYNAICRLLRTS